MPDETPSKTSEQLAAEASAKKQQEEYAAYYQKLQVISEKVIDLLVEGDCRMTDLTALNKMLVDRFNPVFFATPIKEILEREAALIKEANPEPKIEETSVPAPVVDLPAEQPVV